MSYTYGNSLDPGTLARAEDVEAELQGIEAAFANLTGAGGTRPDGLTGVDFPFAVGRAILPQHAIQFGHVLELLALVGGNSSGPLRGYSEYVSVIDPTAGAEVLDLTDSNVFTLAMSQDITLSLFVPAASYSHSVTIYVTGGDLYTLTLGGNIKWPDNTVPTLSGDDIIILHTVDDGANWFAGLVNFIAVGGSGQGQAAANYQDTVTDAGQSAGAPILYWQMGEVSESLTSDFSGNSRNGRYMANIDDSGRTIGPSAAYQGQFNVGHPSFFENVNSQRIVRTSIVEGTVRGLAAQRIACKSDSPYNPASAESRQAYCSFYCDYQDSIALTSGSLTVEMWFMPYQASIASSVGQGGCGALDSSGDTVFGIRVKGPSGPQFYIYDSAARYSSGEGTPLNGSVLAPNHLVGIFNTSTDTVSLYVNKELNSEVTYSGLSIPAAIEQIIVGAEYQSDGTFKDHVPPASFNPTLVSLQGESQMANGIVSQFALYDGIMSVDDIALHYNAGAGIISHQDSHWKLDETSGGALDDENDVQDGLILYDGVTLAQTALINDGGTSVLIDKTGDARSAVRFQYSAFQTDAEHSVTFWFKVPTGETLGEFDICTIKDPSDEADRNVNLRITAAGKLKLIYAGPAGQAIETPVSTATIAVNTTYMISLVFPTTRQTEVHVNGVQDIVTTNTRNVWNFTYQIFLAGDTRASMNIEYDDVKLWGSALTPAQSLAEYTTYSI